MDDNCFFASSVFERVNQASDNGTDTPIELTNITGTYLDHLNEDCLLEIFSSLKPGDLCSLAGTCKRFEQIAQRVFPKEIDIAITNNAYDDEYELSSTDYSYRSIKRANVELFLKNFGNRLSQLTVRRWHKWFLDSIANNNDVVTLKHLNILTNFQQNQDSLMHCWDSIYPKMTGQLVELNVHLSISAWVAYTMSKHTFPNLKQFTFRRNDHCLMGDGVEMNTSHAIGNGVFLEFFDRHTRLRTLKFTEDRKLAETLYEQILDTWDTSHYGFTCLTCSGSCDYSEESSPEYRVRDVSYVDHFIEKNGVNSDNLTLPSVSPHRILMYNNDDKVKDRCATQQSCFLVLCRK